MPSSAIVRRPPSSDANCRSIGYAGRAFDLRLVSPISWAPRKTASGHHAGDPGAKITETIAAILYFKTTIETADGVAIVSDFMPAKMPGNHLVRLVRGIRGSVKLRTELIIRFDYGSVVPWVRRCDDGSLQAVAGPNRLVLRTPVRFRPQGRTHAGEFFVTAGETTDFTLSYGIAYEDVPKAIDPYQALEQKNQLDRLVAADRGRRGVVGCGDPVLAHLARADFSAEWWNGRRPDYLASGAIGRLP